MFNDFEIKFHKDDNWALKYLHVYHGISIADSENEYKKGRKIAIPKDAKLEITKEKTSTNEDYYVLTISSDNLIVYVRAQQKISLEYIIYNSEQKNEKDMGRPMTFVPHLINIDSPLYETRINNFHFKGIINLVVVALIVSHLRLMYDNFVKTGLMLNKETFFAMASSSSMNYFSFCSAIMISSIFMCFSIEKLAVFIKNETVIYLLNFTNFTYLLSTPWLLYHFGYSDPIVGQGALMLIVIVFLKLYSFSHFWLDVRKFIFKKKSMKTEAVRRKSTNSAYLSKISELNLDSKLSQAEKESKMKQL